MKAIVVGIDRVVRILVRIGPLGTGLFRFCPVYTPLGLNTCPLEQKSA